MTSIEKHIHDRLQDLQSRKKELSQELLNIDVRIEELNFVIGRLANEPLAVPSEPVGSTLSDVSASAPMASIEEIVASDVDSADAVEPMEALDQSEMESLSAPAEPMTEEAEDSPVTESADVPEEPVAEPAAAADPFSDAFAQTEEPPLEAEDGDDQVAALSSDELDILAQAGKVD